MRIRLTILALAFAAYAQIAGAAEELVTTAQFADGDPVPYVLNTAGPTPKYVVILFPGGNGVMNPRMRDGNLVYGFAGNFLLRARQYFVDEDFATVATNTSNSEARIQAVLDDIKRRFPEAKIYLAGTSNGTGATMKLAGYLQDRIAGVIHTSSRAQIYSFDAKEFRNRQLVVHHVNDWCWATPYSAARRSHEKFGNDFISMEGGISVGNECEAFAHHGYNGIERETTEAIKAWIRKGG
jgi:pimeloyl-ACP methyl ester carboxylesterase